MMGPPLNTKMETLALTN